LLSFELEIKSALNDVSLKMIMDKKNNNNTKEQETTTQLRNSRTG